MSQKNTVLYNVSVISLPFLCTDCLPNVSLDYFTCYQLSFLAFPHLLMGFHRLNLSACTHEGNWMTDVQSCCMWQVFDGYHCFEFLFLCTNLDFYVPNQLCTTTCEFFWSRSGNSLCSYHHGFSEPHLRRDLWAEFVAGVSAVDKTAWVVKRLLYSFLMVQITLSHRILHSSVSATAVMEILHMLVHRHHCTAPRHHLFCKVMDVYILHLIMGRKMSPPKFCVF